MLEVLEPRQVRPLRRAEFDKLVELGAFDQERVELVRGVLVEMAPQGVPHGNAIEVLTEILVPALKGRARVRVQLSFAASDESELLPDLAVIDKRVGRADHPSKALLLVEVSSSSLRFDRKVKAAIYAEAGVPEYWIINADEQELEVYSQPTRGEYAHVERHPRSAVVAVPGFPDVTVRLSDLFP